MSAAPAVFIHSPEIERYHYPEACPLKTERAAITKSILVSSGYYTSGSRVEAAPVPATRDELCRFHSPEYLDILARASAGTIDTRSIQAGLGTDETPIFPDLLPYATLAAGASLTAARLVLREHAPVVFNPSGGFHHALRDQAGGFCYVNDVVLACDELARAGKRVFCLDIDAHHGNGTQAAFYNRKDVFTLSLHESGKTLYPWGGFEQEIGEGDGRGFNVNLPFPPNTDDEIYLAGYQEIALPLIEAFAPDILVVEIGMDILAVDPLTHLSMTNNAVESVVGSLRKFDKPILAVGGGGYNPQATARGWALAWCTLCGIDFETDLYIGMGGNFLGNAEWDAGLRDMRTYTQGQPRAECIRAVSESVELLKRTVFPIHGL